MIALSSSEEKRKRLLALGASEVVDSSADDWGAQVWQLTGEQGADVVIDYIGGETWPTSLRTTRRGGRLVVCGATTGFVAVTDLRYVWTRELNILGSSGWRRDDLEALIQLVKGGRLDPVVHGVFPLSRVREAIAQLEERRAFGKVLVVPDAVLEGVS